MALSIELWTRGRIADGIEEWWDDLEAMLPDDAAARFPLLGRVDPYGDAVFSAGELDPLSHELDALAPLVGGRTLILVRRLSELCRRGMATDDAELRFIGD